MKLFTKELLKKIPKLSATSNEKNPTIWVKLFYPDFNWTWYLIEYDGADIAFGLVDGFELELGDFSIKELEQNRGKLGCKIERDLYFKPIKLEDLRIEINRKREE